MSVLQVKFARAAAAAGGGALVAVYLLRAVDGVPASLAFHRGWAQARADRLEESLGKTARGETGALTFEAAWLQGDTRLGIWDRLDPGRQRAPAGRELLDRAASDFLRSAEASPAAAWPRVGLAALYLRRELSFRDSRPFDLGRGGVGAWAGIGRDGRVALGFLQMAAVSEPNNVGVRDQVVKTLRAFDLDDQVVEAMREAGRVQPIFDRHENFRFEEFSRPQVEAFAEGARSALGRPSLLTRERHLLALGQLERRLGRLDRAAADLRAAHAEPADALKRAETAFHLGLVLSDLDDAEAARKNLEEAAAHPVFRAAAFEARSRLEEKQGSASEAFVWAERALTVDPSNTARALRAGALARRLGETSAAERIYKRALASSLGHLELRGALVECLLESGDAPAAARALEEMTRIGGASAESARLAEAIERARIGREGL